MDDLFSAFAVILAAILGAVLADFLARRRISDREMFWIWRMVFDRKAFKGPYSWNTELVLEPRPFKQAIDDTIQAINTGLVTTRTGKEIKRGEGKSYVRNPKWRSKMDEVEKSLIRIGKMSEEISKKKSPNGLSKKIDDERDNIIITLNHIWSELGIPTLPIPTKVSDVYSTTLTSLDYDLSKKLSKDK